MLISNLIGKNVSVTLPNGMKYGVLKSIDDRFILVDNSSINIDYVVEVLENVSKTNNYDEPLTRFY